MNRQSLKTFFLAIFIASFLSTGYAMARESLDEQPEWDTHNAVNQVETKVSKFTERFAPHIHLASIFTSLLSPFVHLYADTYLKKWILTPDLETERSPTFLDKCWKFYDRFYNKLFGVQDPLKETKKPKTPLIYSPRVQKFMTNYTNTLVKCGKMTHLTAPHLLLYGKPGTGKTAFMKEILETVQKEIPVHYKMIAGGAFYKYPPHQSIEIVNNLFINAKRDYERTGILNILFIDEIDALLAYDPHQKKDKNQAHLISCILTHLHSDGKGVVLIGATNIFPRKNSHDPEEEEDVCTDETHKEEYSKIFPSNIERRFAYIVKVTLPRYEERLAILREYIQKHVLSNFEDPEREAAFLTEEYIQRLAQRTKGFSGSDLKQMCTNIENSIMAEGLQVLTENYMEAYLSYTFDKKNRTTSSETTL